MGCDQASLTRRAQSILISALLVFGVAPLHAQEATRAAAPPLAAAAAPLAVAPSAARPIDIVLHLQAGDIVIVLDPEHAPLSTANFLHYVDQKRYDGARFYRALKLDDAGQNGLLQGGLRGGRVQEFKPIAHESPAVTGLHHVDGAVSMARNAPGTATSEFFIVVGDLSSLDGGADDPGYAVFGHVESGMPLVHDLLALPRSQDAGDGSMQGQILAEPVKILNARRMAPTVAPAKAP